MHWTTRDCKVLVRNELPLDTVELARCPIGKLVVRETPEGALSGKIVETEAYPVGDAAGHAFRGETLRTHALFPRRGHAYVYLAYGISYMFNVRARAAASAPASWSGRSSRWAASPRCSAIAAFRICAT